MGQVFSQKPLKEIIRENQRMIKKAVRELEREISALKTQEKKLEAEIKKTANQGQMGAVRIMAKDLVRTRTHVKRFIEFKTHLNAVSLKMQTVRSQQALTEAMRGVTKAMVAVNKKMAVPALQKMMAEFVKENEKAELTQEMVGDAVDSAFEDEGDAAEADQVVDQVLAELGIQQGAAAPDAPDKINTPAESEVKPEAQTADPSIMELEARLNNLRRS